jgi:hypothetical protein
LPGAKQGSNACCVETRFIEGRAASQYRVSASQAILDRAYGKPPTFSTQDTTQFKRAIDMTDDELVAIIAQAKAKLTVVK